MRRVWHASTQVAQFASPPLFLPLVMSRSKPYDRRERNLDAPWKHDLHGSNTLAARLNSRSASGSASPSLVNRLGGARGSGRGKELLPDSGRGKMYGFDAPGPNAGVELLPSSSTTRPARATGRDDRTRTGHDDGRALAAKSIAAITGRARERESLSIVGAARSCWVRVERLAKGTTAEDVKVSPAAPAGDRADGSRHSHTTPSAVPESRPVPPTAL